MGFKFYVEHSRATGARKLAIIREERGLPRAFIQKFTVKTFEPNMAVPEDEAFALTDDFNDDFVSDFLQAAANAAWDAGIRPVQAKDATSELAAVRYHLEDMRSMALPAPGGAK